MGNIEFDQQPTSSTPVTPTTPPSRTTRILMKIFRLKTEERATFALFIGAWIVLGLAILVVMSIIHRSQPKELEVSPIIDDTVRSLLPATTTAP